MPIYEYICTACKHEFDQIQKFSDPPVKKCPECKGKVEKKMSQSAFHLKGGGWYASGYVKESKSKKEGSSSISKTNTETSTQSSTSNKKAE